MTELPRQSDADKLRAAAIVAEVWLRFDSATKYGFITGGPKVNVDRCEEVIGQAHAAGHMWTEDEVRQAMIEIIAHYAAGAPND
jgi:hypothetical protein